MDSVSSASQSMMDYINRPSTAARRPPLPSQGGAVARRVVDLSGVALTVPYTIHLGIRCQTEKDAVNVRQRALDVANAMFAEAERVFSPFFPESELQRQINHNTTTERIAVSPAMNDVLLICDDLVRWSDGAFDPTCVAAGRQAVLAIKQRVQAYLSEAAGPEGQPVADAVALRRLQSSSWFPPRQAVNDGAAPDTIMAAAVQHAMAHADTTEALSGLRDTVGWTRLVELGGGWVRKRHPDVQLDVSAVSKGWTVDMLCTRLGEELAVHDLYVDWGGDIRAVGHHDDDVSGDGGAASVRRRPWMAGVLAPPTAASEAAGAPTQSDAEIAFPEAGGTLCTSGDYYQWEHLVDGPRPTANMVDGPPEAPPPPYVDVASVTMLLHDAPCALCDGLTTAVFLLLRRHTQDDVVRRLCERFPGVAIGKLMVVTRQAAAVKDGGAREEGPLTNVCVDLTTACRRQLIQTVNASAATDALGHANRTLSERFRRRLSFSHRDTVPPGGRDSAASCDWFRHRPPSLDTSMLRSIGRAIPRCACILLFPVRQPQPPSSPSPQDGPRRRSGALFGIAATSLVQLSASHVVAFVERGTAAATLVDGETAASASAHDDAATDQPRRGAFYVAVVAPHALHRTHAGDVGLMEAFGSGRLLPNGLQDDALDDCYYVGAYALSHAASMEEDFGSWCGDHTPLLGTWTGHARSRHQPQRCTDNGDAAQGFDAAQWLPTPSSTPGAEAGSTTAARPPLALLMRLRHKYLSVAVPVRRWCNVPRSQCVATVAHGSWTTGTVCLCLGTVLLGLDTTSRQPALWTAYARPGPLHTLLFGGRDQSTAVPSAGGSGGPAPSAASRRRGAPDDDGTAACCVLRLHLFAHGSSEGEALVDWFKDVSCVDPRQQFVYHAAPRRTLTPVPDAPHRWVHAYGFEGAVATVDAVLVRAVPVPGDDGFVVVLSPTQCSITKSAEQLDDATTLSYTFL